MDTTNTLTVGELRRLLTAVETQDMTVRQLRQTLFAVDNQDATADAAFLAQVTVPVMVCPRCGAEEIGGDDFSACCDARVYRKK